MYFVSLSFGIYLLLRILVETNICVNINVPFLAKHIESLSTVGASIIALIIATRGWLVNEETVLKDGFISMDNAQNILVVKTVSGMAMAVAAALDAMKMREIVGSIAGDDTIMIAVRTTQETKEVMGKIREIL